MSGFSNPIIGGGGALVYPSIHSPNFVHLASGWTVDKDGSAEFRNITVSGGSVVVAGSGQGVFVYSGVPASGNLIVSMASAAGSDASGNAYPEGFGLSAGAIPGGLINAGTIDTAQLAALAVNASKIAANTITTAQIAAAAGILGTQIAAATIAGSNLVAHTVTAGQIAANTITAAQIAASTITAGQIAAGTITGSNIAAGTITASNVLAATITAAQIAAGTITASLLAAGIVVAGIVDATTITGANLVLDGSSGTLLVYSGTPAAGNLIMSVSPVNGTDAHTNAYQAGITSYSSLGFSQLSGGNIVVGDIAATGQPSSLFSGDTVHDGNLFITSGKAANLDTAALVNLLSSSAGTPGVVLTTTTSGGRATTALLEVQGAAQMGDGVSVGQGAGLQTLVNGSTIATAGITFKPVTCAGAVTGIILAPGTFDGQVMLVGSSAPVGDTITFAATATSHVMLGVSAVITPGTCARFVWNASLAKWYGPN